MVLYLKSTKVTHHEHRQPADSVVSFAPSTVGIFQSILHQFPTVSSALNRRGQKENRQKSIHEVAYPQSYGFCLFPMFKIPEFFQNPNIHRIEITPIIFKKLYRTKERPIPIHNRTRNSHQHNNNHTHLPPFFEHIFRFKAKPHRYCSD